MFELIIPAFLNLGPLIILRSINRSVYMYLNTRIFPTTGYARVLLFMNIRQELGGTGTGCLFQITYCVSCSDSNFDENC